MIRKAAQLALISASAIMGASLLSPAGAIPAYPVALSPAASTSTVQSVSFWGLPYPYGFQYRSPWLGCSSYSYVHRRYRGRTVRVRVCD